MFCEVFSDIVFLEYTEVKKVYSNLFIFLIRLAKYCTIFWNIEIYKDQVIKTKQNQLIIVNKLNMINAI